MSDEEEPSFFADFAGAVSPVPPRRSITLGRASLPPHADAADEEQSFFQSFSPKTAAELRRYAAHRSAGSIIESMGDRARLPDNHDETVKPNVFGKTVVARVRPFTPEETLSRAKRIVAVTPGHRLALINPHLCQEDPDRVASILSPTTSNETAKVFQFSRSLWSFDAEESSPERMYMDQEGVYEAVGKDMVEYAVKVSYLMLLMIMLFTFGRGFPSVVSPMAIQARARHIRCLEVDRLTSTASSRLLLKLA